MDQNGMITNIQDGSPVNTDSPHPLFKPLAATSNPAMYNANFTDLPIDLASLFRALWRRKVLITIIGISFTVLAILSFLFSTPVYESNAMLELKALPALPKSDLHSETSMSKVNETKYMEAMKRLLESRKLALMVIKKLNLHTVNFDPATADNPTDTEDALLKSYVADFQSRLSVNIEKGGLTGVISLAYQDESPKRAEEILAELVNQFWQVLYEMPEISFAKERTHIKKMIDEAQKKLNDAYNSLNTFLSKNDIFFLENIDIMTKKDIEITSSQLLDLSKTAEAVTHQRIQAESLWNKALTDPEGIREITESQLIMALKEKLAVAQAELADVSTIYTPRYQARMAVAEKIKSLKQAINSEKKNIIETIHHNYLTALSNETDLMKRLDTMKDYVIRKKALKGEYDTIEAEIEINRKVFQSVLQQYEALKIETVYPFTLRLVDPPLALKSPVKPKKMMRMLIGLIFGGIFGASIALLIEFTNPGLRAPVEAERRTGLPMLGIVPPMRKRKIKPGNDLNEQFLQLESWPEFNQAFNDIVGILLSRPGAVLSITSPGDDEGKSFSAIGISRQLMGAGKKVLLIDADFNASKLDKVFNLTNTPGLLDLLERKIHGGHGNVRLDEQFVVAESAGGGQLLALKSGARPENATPLGLIETPSFIELIAQFKNETDYVIIITPPLLREVATYIINRAVDATILVLRERLSRIKDAVRATEVMYRVGISILGLIVTESDYYNK
jgi:uncharacterized protein involved in exopolysaccharide biosynthesis